MLTHFSRVLILCTAFFTVSVMPAMAGDVILTIDGAIAADAPVNMTLEDIEALGTATVVTGTPWHEGPVSFQGVPLASLVKMTGAKGKTLSFQALNNYHSEMPVSDIGEYGVILAYKQNGQYMPVNDKGPLFIVYPFDTDPALNNEVYYARSAWQVRSITVED
jgi:hypothetical protein